METTPQQNSEGKAVVAVLAAVLERLVNSNAHLPNGENVTKFHALKAPGISIQQYLERIHKYASCSTECFILALIYIDRLIQRNNFILSDLNVHRVVITAILLAAKFFDDAYYNNAYYAKVGGVLVSEMNGLEVEFLFRINFSLHVTPEVFVKYQDELVSHAIGAGLESPRTVPPTTSHTQEYPPMVQQQCYPPLPTNSREPTVGFQPKSEIEAESHSHCYDGYPVSKPQHEEQLNQRCHPQFQTQPPSQSDWMPMNKANTNNESTKLVPVRHITPSPPHNKYPKPIQESDIRTSISSAVSRESLYPSLSPAKSAPCGLQNNLLHNPQPKQVTRPRNNSFPTHHSAAAVAVTIAAVAAGPCISQNQLDHNVGEYHGRSNMTMDHPSVNQHLNTTLHTHNDSLSCSHFGRHLSPSTSPHFVTTRRVYQ
jgi:hypothetical protein